MNKFCKVDTFPSLGDKDKTKKFNLYFPLFAPVQTGPGAHPAPYAMGTESFLGVKRQRCGAEHPPPSSVEVEGRVELYIYSPSGPSCPVLG